MEIGQDYDPPLLLDLTELRFQAKNNMRVSLCDIVMDVVKIVRNNGLVRSFQMCEVVVLGERNCGCFFRE